MLRIKYSVARLSNNDMRREEPGEVAGRNMQSTEFADDIRNFNVSDIGGVESTILIPSTSSPLK
jgi:hypothetical protein